MNKISNKTIVLLLALAIVISLGGTFISLNKLSKLGVPLITGMGSSGSGRVNLSIEQAISIKVLGNVSFGSGYTNTSSTYAILESNDTKAQNGTWNWGHNVDFTVENDGTVAIELNLTPTKDANGLIGGTNPKYQYAYTWNETPNTCYEKCPDGNKYKNFTDFTIVENCLCYNLSYVDSRDQLNVSIRLQIPVEPGFGPVIRNDTITFSAAITP